MKKTIGIVGLGFVGNAVFQGMKHAFNIIGYDKKSGLQQCTNGIDYKWSTEDIQRNGIEYLVQVVNGPIFVCVPTPMLPNGSCDTSIVESVVKEIAEFSIKYNKSNVVVIKSTVVPGTTARLNEQYSNIKIVFNPEFLTERASIEDFKKQNRIIVGGPHKAVAIVKQIYETAYPEVPVTKTSSTIAEMVKYTTNCFLAVKVSFANEIEQLCENLEIDYDKVVEYAIKDKRLGTSHWSVPGPDEKKGWGGSCFVKDLNALMKLAEEKEVDCHTMQGAWETNLQVRPEKDWQQLKGRAVVE